MSTIEQEESIILRRPARGVFKNIYVEFEGVDYPDVREKLLALGWKKGVADYESDHYTYYSVHPPSGSQIFGIQTPAEKTKCVKQFKKVLTECGIQNYYEQKYDLRDML